MRPEEFIDEERRRAIGEQIAEGYRKIPQDDEEVAAVTRSALNSIHEEPWEVSPPIPCD